MGHRTGQQRARGSTDRENDDGDNRSAAALLCVRLGQQK